MGVYSMGQLYSETLALHGHTPWAYEAGEAYGVDDDPWSFLTYNPPAGIRGPLLAILLGCIGLASYWGEATLARPMALFSQGMVALLGMVLFMGVFSAGTAIVFTRECVLLVFFVTWIAASYPFVAYPQAVQQGLITLLKLLLMAVVVLHAINGRRSYLWLMWAIIIATVVASVGGASGLARGGETVIVRGGVTQVYTRAVGLFGNPAGLGNLTCMATWASIAIFFITRNKAIKAAMIAFVVFCLIVIGAAGARQSYLGFFVIVMATYWFMIRKLSTGASRKTLWLVLICVSMGAALLYLTTTEHWGRVVRMFDTTGGQEFGESSAQARWELLWRSFRTALEYPIFGVGYNAIAAAYFTGVRMSAHDSLFKIAAETGFVGWGLFFGAWFLMLLRIRKAERLPLPRADRVLLLNSWPLHSFFLVMTPLVDLTYYKVFWALMAANLGYVVWLERTYGSTAYSSASSEAVEADTVYPSPVGPSEAV